MINSPLQSRKFNALKEKNKKVLQSYTKKVNTVDPFAFYQIDRSVYKGERFFWQSPDDETTIIGLGLLRSFFNNRAEDRFSQIEKEWKELLASAVIDNPFDIPGTGPLLFGGFSFDPYSVKEKIWQPYGDALFYLPQYMLTIYDGDCYLTVNMMETEEAKDKSNEVKQTFDLLMQNAVPSKAFSPVLKEMEEVSVPKWLSAVAEVVEALQTSDSIDKVVLSRKVKLHFSEPISTELLLERLHIQQPDSFIFLLETDASSFVGASPERLVKKVHDTILSTSLAGSIGRDDKDPVKDKRLGNMLLNDEKNLFEHALVVDMIKKALQPYCEELNVPKEPALLKTSYIQHLYTPVSGTAKSDTTIFQLVERLHPTPALGGVPTDEALKLIRDKEKMDRGLYAAPVGWMDFSGNGEFIVAIRSGLVKEEEAFLYAGCGLVADSDPNDELIETSIKFQPMLRAMGGTDE